MLAIRVNVWRKKENIVGNENPEDLLLTIDDNECGGLEDGVMICCKEINDLIIELQIVPNLK